MGVGLFTRVEGSVAQVLNPDVCKAALPLPDHQEILEGFDSVQHDVCGMGDQLLPVLAGGGVDGRRHYTKIFRFPVCQDEEAFVAGWTSMVGNEVLHILHARLHQKGLTVAVAASMA